MKIRETLSEQDYTKIFDRDVVGIFKYLFDSDDKFYSMNVDACLYYYLQRSANKTISPFYEELLKRAEDANLLISKVVRARFLEKWNKIYDALMLSEYNAIEDYVHKKDKTETEENGNVYRSETTGDGNTGSETETTSTSEGYDDVYGFNSEESVHSGKNGSTDNELVTADSSKTPLTMKNL